MRVLNGNKENHGSREYWKSFLRNAVAELLLARNQIVSDVNDIQDIMVRGRIKKLINAGGDGTFHRMFRVSASPNLWSAELRWYYYLPRGTTKVKGKDKKIDWVSRSVPRSSGTGVLKLRGINGVTAQVIEVIKDADDEVRPLIATSRNLYNVARSYMLIMDQYKITKEEIGFTRTDLVVMAHGYNPVTHSEFFFDRMGHPSTWSEAIWSEASKMEPVPCIAENFEEIPS